MDGIDPIAGMPTITSTVPRSGLPEESRAATRRVLSPTRGGSGSFVAPTCQAPIVSIGMFAGAPP